MEIISHRGLWKTPREKNARSAFRESFELGFGTETDIRDRMGDLVISHDMPNGSEMLFADFLDMAGTSGLPLALNIKSDGLALAMREILDSKGTRNWFVFDMSVPDMRQHLSFNNPVYTRVSEIEKEPPLYEESTGIWLDAFFGTWYTPAVIEKFLADGKNLCIVSPELHKRDHTELWNMLKSSGIHKRSGVILCTDIPDRAAEYFK